jgi:hypothetical protein
MIRQLDAFLAEIASANLVQQDDAFVLAVLCDLRVSPVNLLPCFRRDFAFHSLLALWMKLKI